MSSAGLKQRKQRLPRIAPTGREGMSTVPEAAIRSRSLHLAGMMAVTDKGCGTVQCELPYLSRGVALRRTSKFHYVLCNGASLICSSACAKISGITSSISLASIPISFISNIKVRRSPETCHGTGWFVSARSLSWYTLCFSSCHFGALFHEGLLLLQSIHKGLTKHVRNRRKGFLVCHWHLPLAGSNVLSTV
jgi:hypothetical protein